MTTTHPASSASPPPIAQVGPIAWLRKNLFSSWFDTILTVVILVALLTLLKSLLTWATTTAKWELIPANLPLFFVGRYPADQRWRIWAALGLIVSLSGLTWGILGRNIRTLFSRSLLISLGIIALVIAIFPMSIQNPYSATIPTRLLLIGLLGLLLATAWAGRRAGSQVPGVGKWLSLAWFVFFAGMVWLGLVLQLAARQGWGGLLLTVFISVVSIFFCFPLGVLLALGRQSSLPVLRWLSILYIELIRGVPLIAILFIGQNMIPLFLPTGMRPDNVVRAIVGLTIFSAAYLAENVRGGLQAIPRGQIEAANALGLNPVLATSLIVLPQALKISIPALVGQFISLVQDTTLLSIVSIVELLGITRAILANPQFLGRYWEGYLFIGFIYWILCYAMSWGSRRLEDSLNTGR